MLAERPEKLERLPGMNSGDSSRPPSTEGPEETPQKHKPKSLQKRGGLAGHMKRTRPLIPTDQYDLVFSCRRTTLKRVTLRAWCNHRANDAIGSQQTFTVP